MNTKELIEKQIEEAAKALERADYQLGKMQEREKSTPEEKALGYLSAYCERVLQVVQNQQAQIEASEKRASGFLEAYEDVRRRNNSLMDTVRKLKGAR